MANITLNLKKSLFTPKAFPYITDYSHRWECWYGGSGSSKSYSICQKLIIRACREPIRILVCRRYASTLRNTCFSLFKEILTKWKLISYVNIRETDFHIEFPNKSEIIFLGLDEETKLLSLNNIGTVWIEEAYEVPKEIVEQLDLRMRSRNANQQIIMSWNPISKDSWLYQFVEVAPPANSVKIHSTFKDNPFLNKEYVAAMEDLLVRNPRKAEVYYYGAWGSDPEGLVFQNWHVEEFDPQSIVSLGLELRAGCDEGFTDPSVIIASLWDQENNKIYVYDEFYKSGCQLDEIASAIKSMRLTKTKIYCDSAAPRLIDYLKRQNLPAYPCIKGPDSVEARIAFLQNHQIIIHPKCENVIREFENYAYEKGKDGKYTGRTLHEYSHSIDALGYAYSDIYTKGKVKTFNKALLGL